MVLECFNFFFFSNVLKTLVEILKNLAKTPIYSTRLHSIYLLCIRSNKSNFNSLSKYGKNDKLNLDRISERFLIKYFMWIARVLIFHNK